MVYGSGNDTVANLKQLVCNDYSSSDGVTTGMKAFNTSYPLTTANHCQFGFTDDRPEWCGGEPALWLVSNVLYDIGWQWLLLGIATMAAAGAGNGNLSDRDDDGVVGSTQQQGYRLEYVNCTGCLDYVYLRTGTGTVTNLNAPNSHADDLTRMLSSGSPGCDRCRTGHLRRTGILRRDYRLYRRPRRLRSKRHQDRYHARPGP